MDETKKRVRYLLRVSSDQQLEADGDLGIQRQLVTEYIQEHSDWILDDKEYFEGSNSGYKNSVADRDILQAILEDAQNQEFDILVVYKDDRLGRRMWEVSMYIMQLKNFGVDVYTVKDGLISPESDDLMGQVMLNFRYAMAQKSSLDTGMRVKDTAQKLVQQGKFMGGKAPYGYQLELSGEISKHGRALKHLVIVPERAEIVKYIYDLSLNKEYGSSKIATILNGDDRYKGMAPNDVWKSGTITSILTNPIYTGHTAYKRRERVNGKYRNLNSEDWIISEKINEDIVIIEEDIWNKVQEKRKLRSDKYTKKLENQDVTIIKRNDGMLPLVDVLHCGYCGCKMVNGSKYNYWTIKDTGERRTSKAPIYKCQNAWQGVPHDKTKSFRADFIEPIVFEAMAEYIAKLQENEDVFEQISQKQNKERMLQKRAVEQERKKLNAIKKDIDVMENEIPKAINGESKFSVDMVVNLIDKLQKQEQEQSEVVKRKEYELNHTNISVKDWEDIRSKIPTWQDIFMNADSASKRVLVNKLIERIDIKKDEVIVRFKINLNDFFLAPRISINDAVPKQRLRLYDYIFYCIRSEMD